MKGIAIYESPFMGERYVRAVNLCNANYEFVASPTEDAEVTLSGYFNSSAQAKCSKKDSYDFEVGALIALMRSVGKAKIFKALDEVYPGDPMIFRCHELEESNKHLCEVIEVLKEEKAGLINTNKALTDARNLLLDESIHRLRDKIDLKEKYIALKAENERLKTDCEKLQKGYSLGKIVTINGVKYREVEKTWFTSQPEHFSFEAEYIDTVALEALRGKKAGAVYIDEWAYKKPSKREQMWDKILAPGRTPVYVKREDIHDFLEECQVVGIKWSTGKFPLETIPFHISAGYEGVYFFIMTSLDISKSTPGAKEFSHTMTWWMTACPAEAEAAIHYIRPMRWDLFEKGRIYIRVKAEHFDEFQKACKSHLESGKCPLSPFHCYSHGDVIVCYTDEHFRLTKTLVGFKKRPVVNWEDVR